MGAAREIGLGLIGLGAWGPNLLRTFGSVGGCRVRRVADLDEERVRGAGDRRRAPRRSPATTARSSRDPAIDAVAIATPSETHYRIGREALLAGKHLFVEKPLALSSREGQRLVDLARERRRTLMVGHLLMYHPAVIAMAGLVRRGRIGKIRYLGIRRRAFGRLQGGCSVLWDLGPHDISIALMVTGGRPAAVSSLARAFIQPGLPEISFTAISLAGGALAHIEESWLAPLRERQLLAVGDKGMLLFDELAADGAHLKHFAKAIKVRAGAAGQGLRVPGRGGEPDRGRGRPAARGRVPGVPRVHPPRAASRGRAATNAVTVLRVLEAAERSQRAGGREIKVMQRREPGHDPVHRPVVPAPADRGRAGRGVRRGPARRPVHPRPGARRASRSRWRGCTACATRSAWPPGPTRCCSGCSGPGVRPGDEVITTPFTFVATAEVIEHAGARPVFVDIDEATFNLDPAQIEARITERTRAIIPVHLYGLACDMAAIGRIAQRHKLKVIEDCAQATGSRWMGRLVGGIGDAGAFSFFPTKNLGAIGDGGMVLTDNDTLAEKVRMLRGHGAKVRDHYELLGYNSRLDSLQAAVLSVKLPAARGVERAAPRERRALPRAARRRRRRSRCRSRRPGRTTPTTSSAS